MRAISRQPSSPVPRCSAARSHSTPPRAAEDVQRRRQPASHASRSRWDRLRRPPSRRSAPAIPIRSASSRVVEIDTTGGPGFGFQHYKTYDFLNPKEVVLTFDDGPLPNRTTAILAALDARVHQGHLLLRRQGRRRLPRDPARRRQGRPHHRRPHRQPQRSLEDEVRRGQGRDREARSASSTARSAARRRRSSASPSCATRPRR